MTSFQYVITDPLGIHARPAGILTKTAAGLTSSVTMSNGTKQGDAKKIMSVMMLAIKCGQEITVTVEGENEKADAEVLKKFFAENL